MKKLYSIMLPCLLLLFFNMGQAQTFDLSLTKTLHVFDNDAYPGEEVTFIFEVTNEGTVDATDIEITDYIPEGLILDDIWWSLEFNDETTYTISSLAAGASIEIEITFTVDEDFQGLEIENSGEITDFSNAQDLNDNYPLNDDDVAKIDIIQTFDLALQKDNPVGDFVPGGNVTYDITISNLGTLNAEDIEITDYIPEGLTLNDPSWDEFDDEAIYDISSLPSEESITIPITFTIDVDFPGEYIENTAEITDADNVPNLDDEEDSNDSDEAIIEIIQTFDLALQKTANFDSFVPGEEVTFYFEVTNEGTIEATDIEITDFIPTGLVLVDADWSLFGSKATQIIPSLAPSTTVTIPITFLILNTFQGTSITNQGEISDAENNFNFQDIDSSPNNCANIIEDDCDEAAITIIQTFDLALRKTNPVGNFIPGGQVTYSIQIFNQGSLDANNIEITDYIPSGLILNDAQWTQMASAATYTIPSLLAGDSTTISITFGIDMNYEDGCIENAAEISNGDNSLGMPDQDSQLDAINGNDITIDNIIDNQNGDEDDYDIESILIENDAFFDLALRKTGAVGDFVPGGEVTFALQVFNQGTLEATNINIIDYGHDGLVLNDGQWSTNGTAAAFYTLPSLAAGDSATIMIHFLISNTYQGIEILNIAEIYSADNVCNIPDVDSTPDQLPNNDIFVDNVIDEIAAIDEDDHDIEEITITQTFDLALRKTYTTLSGNQITYTFEVINQGSINATDVVITDYIPSVLELNDSAWELNDSLATYTISSLPGYTSETITITFTIMADDENLTIQNAGEISSAQNILDLSDIDSAMDSDSNNDVVVDDVIDNAGGDEDDHDIDIILFEQEFDLALRKTNAVLNFDQGESITYDIQVFNQGSLDATNIEITDYYPMELTLNDAEWSETGTNATYTIPSLLAGDSTTISITFEIDSSALETEITNIAEISSAENIYNLLDIDSTPDQISDNDNIEDDSIDNENNDEDDHDIEQILITAVNSPVNDSYQVIVSPNPADYYFTLSIKNSELEFLPKQLFLYDTNGRLILNKDFSSNHQEINTQQLAQGLYHYRLEVEGRIAKRGRIIIQR